MINKFVRKAREFKSDIDLINWHLTIINQPDARVSVENETPVTKIYLIKFKSCGAECQKSVEFDGSITNFFQSINIRNYGLRSVESSGYMGWKLGVLHRDLDKKIKKQEKVRERDAKRKIKAEKKMYALDCCTRVRCAMADLVFGRGNQHQKA